MRELNQAGELDSLINLGYLLDQTNQSDLVKWRYVLGVFGEC